MGMFRPKPLNAFQVIPKLSQEESKGIPKISFQVGREMFSALSVLGSARPRPPSRNATFILLQHLDRTDCGSLKLTLIGGECLVRFLTEMWLERSQRCSNGVGIVDRLRRRRPIDIIRVESRRWDSLVE
jgi:hypothetical protein